MANPAGVVGGLGRRYTMWHPSSTIPGIVHSESLPGHEAFWRGGQLLVAEEADGHPSIAAELAHLEYESAGGIRRYRLPEEDTEEVFARLAAVSELDGLVSVNHLFAAQHRPPWYDHPHETYHFTNYEVPRPFGAWNPPEPPEPPQSAATVGIVDTVLDNPWLSKHALTVEIPTESPRLPEDALGHADLVAGVVLSRAPGARLVDVPVMSAGGLVEEFDVIRALELEVIGSCNVILLAFAGYTEDDQPPPALATALGRPRGDQVVIAAAGNGGRSRIRWPAGLPGVVSVGAVDSDGGLWPPSDFGPWVDVVAPGVEIASTYGDRGAVVWSGTSAAAAAAAGRVASMIGQGMSPRLAVAELRPADPPAATD